MHYNTFVALAQNKLFTVFSLKMMVGIDVASISVHIAMRKGIIFCAELNAIIVFVWWFCASNNFYCKLFILADLVTWVHLFTLGIRCSNLFSRYILKQNTSGNWCYLFYSWMEVSNLQVIYRWFFQTFIVLMFQTRVV